MPLNDWEKNSYGDYRGSSPNSRKNLEKGRTGHNHSGRDYSITRIVKEMIDDVADEKYLAQSDQGKGLTWRKAIALKLLRDSVSGRYGEILDRLEGKVPQSIGGYNGGPVTIKVEYGSNSQSAPGV